MKALLVSILAMASCLVYGDDLRSKHNDLFKNIDHMEVDFSQTIYKKLRNRKINRSGTAYFSKPNFFRWNFMSEQLGSEEFYYNGKTLTHFRANEKLVTNYNANIGLARELNEVVSLVLDPQTLSNRYDLVNSSKAKGQTVLTLRPRVGAATDISQIEIKISDQEKYVRGIKIEYMDENYTQFVFKNPKFSPNDKKIFIFSKKGEFTFRHHG